MTLNEIKGWIETLPEEFLDYPLVWRNVAGSTNDRIFVKDVGIASAGIDEDNKETYFCDEDTHQAIENLV